jgi:hypothetical protein
MRCEYDEIVGVSVKSHMRGCEDMREPVTLEQINEKGKEGWHVVSVHRNDKGEMMSILIEKTRAVG